MLTAQILRPQSGWQLYVSLVVFALFLRCLNCIQLIQFNYLSSHLPFFYRSMNEIYLYTASQLIYCLRLL